MEKREIARKVRPLLQSEWNTIRGGGLNRDPIEGCGLLFVDGFAFATNGHYAIRISSPTNAREGRAFWLNLPKFYSANEDDLNESWFECNKDDNPLIKGVVDNHPDIIELHSVHSNPYSHAGAPLHAIKRLFAKWHECLIRVNVQDLMNSIQSAAREVKERRRLVMICQVSYNGTLTIAYKKDDVVIGTDTLILWKRDGEEVASTPYTWFVVNANYLFKALNVFEGIYNVVTISFDPINEDIVSGRDRSTRTIILKGHSPNKPDMRVAIIQPNPSV